MIRLLVDSVVNIFRVLRNMEKTLAEICESVNFIRATVSDPAGFLTFKGVLMVDPERLRRDLRDPVTLELHSAAFDVKFSQAFFMATMPNIKESLHERMTPEAIFQAKELLTEKLKLQSFLKEAESATKKAVVSADEARRLLDFDVERLVKRRELDVHSHVE